jgi:hypothetical protein
VGAVDVFVGDDDGFGLGGEGLHRWGEGRSLLLSFFLTSPIRNSAKISVSIHD